MAETLINVVLVIAVILWFGIRRLAWSPFTMAGAIRLPAIMGVIGLFTLSKVFTGAHIASLDLTILAIEAIAAVLLGMAMGLVSQVRPITAERADVYAAGAASENADRRSPLALAVFESRTPWLGLVFWFIFIALRVTLGIVGSSSGSAIATSTGVILTLLAINRIAAALVTTSRVGRLEQHSTLA